MYKCLRDEPLYFCITLAFFIFLYSIYFNDSLTLKKKNELSRYLTIYWKYLARKLREPQISILARKFLRDLGKKKKKKKQNGEARKREGGRREKGEAGREEARAEESGYVKADRTRDARGAGASIVGGKREFALSHPRIYPTPSSQGAGLRYHPCRPHLYPRPSVFSPAFFLRRLAARPAGRPAGDAPVRGSDSRGRSRFPRIVFYISWTLLPRFLVPGDGWDLTAGEDPPPFPLLTDRSSPILPRRRSLFFFFVHRIRYRYIANLSAASSPFKCGIIKTI